MSTNTAENLENEVEETTEIEIEIEEAPVEEKQEPEAKVEEAIEEPKAEPEPEPEVKEENSDAEIDKYSAGVQKRIDQLTKKYRDEEKLEKKRYSFEKKPSSMLRKSKKRTKNSVSLWKITKVFFSLKLKLALKHSLNKLKHNIKQLMKRVILMSF